MVTSHAKDGTCASPGPGSAPGPTSPQVRESTSEVNMRLLKVVLLFLALPLAAPPSVAGQLNLNAGASYAEALGGQWGIEGRIGFYPPALPVDLFGGVEYFLADCEEDCSLWGWRMGANLHTGTPGLQPFLSGSYVGRKWERGSRRLDRTGVALGAGLRVGVGKLRVQAEVSREFLGDDLNQWVFRVGSGD